jgi:hypothetical protein
MGEPESPRPPLMAADSACETHGRTVIDCPIAFGLATLAAATSFVTSGFIPHALYRFDAPNVWFQADLPRVFTVMTDPSYHARSYYHPLFGILTQPAVAVLRALTGLPALVAVRALVAAYAGVWACLLYSIAIALSLRKIEALVLTLIAVVSSAALFWWAVPETYGLGSLSLLVVLRMSLRRDARHLSGWVLLGSNLLALGTTVTNGLLGFFLTLRARRLGSAIRHIVMAVVIVTAVWGIQKMLHPDRGIQAQSGISRNPTTEAERAPTAGRESKIWTVLTEERHYARALTPSEIAEAAAVFVLHSVVAPPIESIPGDCGRGNLSVQDARPGGTGVIGLVSLAIWGVLLVTGTRAFFAAKSHGTFRVVLGCGLLWQLTLHIVYGSETFLYALHYGPLLLILTAYAFHCRQRWLVLAGAVCLLLLLSYNNVHRFWDAIQVASDAVR